jgi:(1->4)-alpha-D-glucan 1-alpha-D-glucosylmutase
MSSTGIPRATYRLQFNRDFTFQDATEIIPYLAALGISHIYASPYLRARPGSTHGYDIIDHNHLNPEIGTPEDFDRMVETLHRHGMGQILDLVPNHMGVMGADNAWWMDVLENGESSNFAEFFDIDWQPLKDELQGKVLVPVLDDQYGTVLDRGELKLAFDPEKGEFCIWYHQNRFPIDPREYPQLLTPPESRKAEFEGNADVLELQSLISSFGHLPGRTAASAEMKAERNRDKEIHKRRLVDLCSRAPLVVEIIQANVSRFNGVAGDNATFNELHELIKAQAFRLAYWRVAADDINYRRFFDINELAGLRMENPAVFDATHQFVMTLLREGKVNGFRIDHPDGLFDPAEYFQRIRAGNPGYLVVEKILSRDETLRSDWAVDGTTGYDFSNVVNGLFVDQGAATKIGRTYRGFLGEHLDFRKVLYECKTMVMETALTSELNVLANLLSRIALANRHTCDFTVNGLREALIDIVGHFSVYRTYLTETSKSDEDRWYIDNAVNAAKSQSDAQDTSVYDFVRQVLQIGDDDKTGGFYRRVFLRFAMKFQQFTSPVMAKGLEDTSFFRYHPLMSLNDVGGNPRQFGVSVKDFHSSNMARGLAWPNTMLSTSTHDSKLSEDVRARINVLSELPAAWRLRAGRWRRLNQDKKQLLDGVEAPSRNDEYLFYQVLLGAWPAGANELTAESCERFKQYMLKAAREAKERTSWNNQNAGYEKSLLAFVDAVVAPRNREFLSDFLTFQRGIARVGAFNSISQTLLKLTCPGVPDIYQGNEVSEFRLVDPDNRRVVDYSRRRKMLQEFEGMPLSEHPRMARRLMDDLQRGDDQAGCAKMFVIWKVLQARKKYPVLNHGDYEPLLLKGEGNEQLVAFARRHHGVRAVVIVPRMCGRPGAKDIAVAENWQQSYVRIPRDGSRTFRNVITEEEHTLNFGESEDARVDLGSLMRVFPWVLLVGTT